jgi:hypothetical protein
MRKATVTALGLLLMASGTLAASSAPIFEARPVVACSSGLARLPESLVIAPHGDCIGSDRVFDSLDILSAERSIDPKRAFLTLHLSTVGHHKLFKFTLGHVNTAIVFILDGVPVSTVLIETPILGSQVQMPGLSPGQIDELVNAYKPAE